MENLACGILENEFFSEVEDEGRRLRMVGIYGKNSEEWVMVDLACLCSDVTSVTLYDTLGVESTEYIIN